MRSKFTLIYMTLALSMNCFSSVKTIGGHVDEIDNNNGVIHLAISGSVESSACTATKIAENYLITAAHCFHGQKIEALGVSTLSVNPSFDFSPLEFEQVFMHPDFEKLSVEDVESVSPTFSTPDIAIVKVIPSEEFKKIKIVSIDYDYIEESEVIEFWGYGCQETLNDISGYVATRKKAVTVTVGESSMQEGYGVYTDFYRNFSKDAYEVSIFTVGKSKDSSKASLCLGDSGGPVIRNNKIVGINSNYTFDDLSAEGTESGISYLNLHSRLSFVSTWIKQIVGD
ncbi:MAG: trypsin-like serine protease [Halobacteriovoraceae bacterium]|jgi:V8-like Glu-specific endopeptidase|nr:trypsin-like serine protease [Halobacteriovoraceae bacterium]